MLIIQNVSYSPAFLIYFSLQYFDELTGVPAEDLPYYGGSVEIADYCPFSQEFSWHLSGEYQRSSDCRVLENQPGQQFSEVKCYIHIKSIYKQYKIVYINNIKQTPEPDCRSLFCDSTAIYLFEVTSLHLSFLLCAKEIILVSQNCEN